MRRFRASEEPEYTGAPHGALGPLCAWDARPDYALRVVPSSQLQRVCAVIPHVPPGSSVSAASLDVSTVQLWWVNVHNLDRAGPSRGLDWQAGIPLAARARPAPVLEEMCELCHGIASVDSNRMYVCEIEGCLNGWHKACLEADGRRAPGRNMPFYCKSHAPLSVQVS
jgi:hypothetical protein